MKQLIFSLAVAFLAVSCQKQLVDCGSMQSHCIYILPSFTDCTPNGDEIGWQWDRVRYDTIEDNLTWGCPEQIELDWERQQQNILNSPNTPNDTKEFIKRFPSTCNCD